MGREDLSKDDQEQLDYIDAWWAMKREKEYQKQERRKERKLYLSGVRYHMRRVLAELQQYFRLLLGMK